MRGIGSRGKDGPGYGEMGGVEENVEKLSDEPL